jgi:hypothetical protein
MKVKSTMKSMKILLAIVAGSFLLGTPLYAQFSDSRIGSVGHERQEKQAIEAKPITQAEAQKKYPVKGGAYPTAERNPHDPSGVVRSPYPPNDRYDCSKVAHGGLVVDVKANKVFVRP